MKFEERSPSENKLWELCAPQLYEQSAREGSYIMPSEEKLLQRIRENGGGSTILERAYSRLDMALACLWPQVKYLFNADFFPHRLAAATELLRAAQFGEGEKAQLEALGMELAAALDALEYLLSAGQPESFIQAAEDPEHV
jgi:hypothetical protein